MVVAGKKAAVVKATKKLAQLPKSLPRRHEAAYWKKGLVVAGVDEAGRGPLAGPVVAAACIAPKGIKIKGVNDSKIVTEEKRDQVFELLTTNPKILWAVNIVDTRRIDEINILQATFEAMSGAVADLGTTQAVLVDGPHVPPQLKEKFGKLASPLIGGDAVCFSIAAASIIAKVTRDRLMAQLELEYPGYSLGKHKGYGTAAHLAAIRALGPSPIHRRSFEPLRSLFPDHEVEAWIEARAPAPKKAMADKRSKVAKAGAKNGSNLRDWVVRRPSADAGAAAAEAPGTGAAAPGAVKKTASRVGTENGPAPVQRKGSKAGSGTGKDKAAVGAKAAPVKKAPVKVAPVKKAPVKVAPVKKVSKGAAVVEAAGATKPEAAAPKKKASKATAPQTAGPASKAAASKPSKAKAAPVKKTTAPKTAGLGSKPSADAAAAIAEQDKQPARGTSAEPEAPAASATPPENRTEPRAPVESAHDSEVSLAALEAPSATPLVDAATHAAQSESAPESVASPAAVVEAAPTAPGDAGPVSDDHPRADADALRDEAATPASARSGRPTGVEATPEKVLPPGEGMPEKLSSDREIPVTSGVLSRPAPASAGPCEE